MPKVIFPYIKETKNNTMKNLIFLLSLMMLSSCSNVQHPDYERNLEITKQWFDVFVTEDFDATMEFYADNVEYQSAFYGGPLMNKEALGEYIKGWQDAMEDISWEAQNYLPGVDPETSLPNGSVRTYGHWSGTHSVSGKSFKGLWYHYLTFDENGKIIEGGDFGDATGLVMAVMPDEE